jgi:hypothetical protein
VSTRQWVTAIVPRTPRKPGRKGTQRSEEHGAAFGRNQNVQDREVAPPKVENLRKVQTD